MTIKLTESTFVICPEGEHIFQITSVEFNETFKKIVLNYKTTDGFSAKETFSLMTGTGDRNQVALNTFSYLAKVCFNDFTLTEIDPLSLKDKWFKANVTHIIKDSTTKPGEKVTFIKYENRQAVTGDELRQLAEKTPAPAEEDELPVSAPKSTGFDDLKAIFG